MWKTIPAVPFVQAVVGFIGDEFKTAREILTKRLAGDTAFRTARA